MIDKHRKFLGSSALAAAVAACLLAAPTAGWTQTADATLRGAAAPGADVTATNVATGAVRRTKAGEDGSYRLLGLTPGTYRVDAGPGTENVVTLNVATNNTLDLTPATGEAPTETVAATTMGEVEVTANRLMEVKTSEVGTIVSQHQLETTPQITRNFLEFADTVAGMTFDVDSSGNTRLRGGAQTTASINLFIDGIGQKNYVKEGGVTGQSESQGNPFPQLAIGEYKVITSNYKAEYDQVSSAAITAVTRSGTNTFQAEMFGTYSDADLRAETPAEKAADNKSDSESKEYGLSLGGPIIEDRLHYFFTYEGKRFDQPITVIPGVTDTEALLPPEVAAEFGPGTFEFEEDLFFAKLDYELGFADRLEVSARVRDEVKTGNFGNQTALSSALDTNNDDTRIAARWQHNADSWFNDLTVTYEDAFFNPTSRSSGNGFSYSWNDQQNAHIVAVGPADPRGTQNKGQKGPGLQNDLTITGIEWLGQHTFKTGVKFKEVELTAQDAGTGNPRFTVGVTPAGTEPQPYKVFFVLPVPGLSPVAVSENRQFGLYFQDDWDVNDRLQLNLGLRYDYEETPSYLDYRTPDNVIAALSGPNPAQPTMTYAESLALGGVDVNDYISTGGNRDTDDDNIQPRIGFSYDLTGEQKYVLFGGAGRSYDRNLFQWIQLEQTKGALPNFNINFDVPLHDCVAGPTCVAWDPGFLEFDNLAALVTASNAGGEVFMINNNIDVPYSDQFSLGVRSSLGEWFTAASVVRVLSYDGFTYTLGNRYSNGDFWQGGSQPWGNPVPGFGALIIGNNGIETRSTSVLLSAERPFTEASRWSTTFAYTFTDAKGNRDINETFAFDAETIGDYPFITSNAVPRHRFVATGSYEAPWGILLGAKVTVASPIPVNAIACYGATFPSGSGCTPIDGRPDDTIGYKSLDLQVTKNFDIGDISTLYLRFDLLNALNEENFNDTLQNWGQGGVLNPDPVKYAPTGNIKGVPRTVRLTFGAKF
jgi:outer membrane receptor protein involved in Fe transport